LRNAQTCTFKLCDFGRFRVLLRQRQLLADGVPIELGTRAFELLLALLEANGSLISKEQLLARVWPRIVVAVSDRHDFEALRRLSGHAAAIAEFDRRGVSGLIDEARAALVRATPASCDGPADDQSRVSR
jgi:DNA-binding response OmpR family regulator